MVTRGTVGGLKIKEFRKTYYKMHPDQKKYPGTIIEMPNLPNDQYHWELWQGKGYKLSPQELFPDKKVVKNADGEWVAILDSPSDIPQATFKCQICGKECVGNFGLQAHMRKHEKEKEQNKK